MTAKIRAAFRCWRLVEIEHRKGRTESPPARAPKQPPLERHPDRDQEEPTQHDGRQHDERHEAAIGRRPGPERLCDEEEGDECEADDRDHDPGVAQPVVDQRRQASDASFALAAITFRPAPIHASSPE